MVFGAFFGGVCYENEYCGSYRTWLDRCIFYNRPSTLQDLENHKKTEVEMFAGTVVDMGKKLGVPTPVSWMFYHGIKVHEEKNAGLLCISP